MSPLDDISICVIVGIFLVFALYIALSVSHTIACAVVAIGHWLTPMTIFSSFVPELNAHFSRLITAPPAAKGHARMSHSHPTLPAA